MKGRRETKKETAAGTPKLKKPFYCLERTRSQVMCRTGVTGIPGQCHGIQYAKGGEDQAIKKAKKWVEDNCKKRGLSPPKWSVARWML